MDHVFRYRGFGNLDTQFEEFATNPRCAPDDVFAAHDSYPFTILSRNCRPSRSAVTNLPRPIPPESLPVPSNDGFTLDDNQDGAPCRPQMRQPSPEPSIGTIQQEPFW